MDKNQHHQERGPEQDPVPLSDLLPGFIAEVAEMRHRTLLPELFDLLRPTTDPDGEETPNLEAVARLLENQPFPFEGGLVVDVDRVLAVSAQGIVVEGRRPKLLDPAGKPLLIKICTPFALNGAGESIDELPPLQSLPAPLAELRACEQGARSGCPVMPALRGSRCIENSERPGEFLVYVAQEIVHGADLMAAVQLVAETPGADLRHLIMSVLSSVEQLHRAGIVHLDLSPSNIIVGAGTSVHLIDFGYSEVVPPAPTGRPGGEQAQVIAMAQSLGEALYSAYRSVPAEVWRCNGRELLEWTADLLRVRDVGQPHPLWEQLLKEGNPIGTLRERLERL